MKGKNVLGITITIAAIFLISVVCFAAYQHKGEKDSKKFLAIYPGKSGTKLDSCTLCHTGGSYDSGGKTVTLGSCQWCHYKYGYDGSGDIGATLNPYGIAYRDSGRNQQAIQKIAKLDSDGDGFTNAEEIKADRFPGDKADDPTKIYAPSVVYTKQQLEAMPQHTQFMLMNTTKSGDFYVEYSGVTMENLLADARIISDTSTNIQVYAPDGFSQYLSLEPDPLWYHVNGVYPAATFHYTTTADVVLNPVDGWCNYSAPSCAGRNDGEPIVVQDGLRLLLAIKRDGEYLTPGVLNAQNKLDGEGPYRVVTPQKVEGPPDQASTAANQTVVWPYDPNADHNAGSAARSATIIKVVPLPPGTTDINTYEAGWGYVDNAKVVVYGNIIRAISINGDAGCTLDPSVNLTLNPPVSPEEVIISNTKQKSEGKKMTYASNRLWRWKLTEGKGMKNVHVWFKTGQTVQGPFTSSIYFGASCPLVETAKVGE